MKKQLLILFFLLSVSLYSSAQVTFQKTFGSTQTEYGNSVLQTSDGGYVIAGYTSDSGYIIKTDSDGDTLWTKVIARGGSNYFLSIQQIITGGFIIGGYSDSSAFGTVNLYLGRTDNNGNLLWAKTYDYDGVNDFGFFVQQTNDGGYVIVGEAVGTSLSGTDIYLIKTDSSGTLVWSKSIGGPSDDYANSVKQTNDGGYIISGTTLSFGAGSFDCYLVKVDSSGNHLWSKTFGETSGDLWSKSVFQTADSGYILVAQTGSFGAGNLDIYLIKTDNVGNLLWSKTFGGTGYELIDNMNQTNDGGFIIIGETDGFGFGNYDIYLIKVDSSGNLLWSKNYGGTGHDYGYSVQQTNDGGYIITGRTNSFGAGSYDIYLIKTDSLGNSNCNEGNPATISTVASTQVTTPPTFIYSPTIIVSIPGVIPSNGSIVNTLCLISNVIPESNKNENSISLFPNPATNQLAIENGQLKIVLVEIYNVLGEKRLTINPFPKGEEIRVNVSSLASGIHFVKMFDGEKYYCKKIIIERD